ncbi:hypothetical protein [Flavobacterium cerinum]|uniref:Uncharacterized protein n=1 Tax=Flavobacterium cerinum TaxID=2502784 RepID=A0A444HEN7_9FLAO|nr:hypothetical protein [Flavobacterium cerinum]RWX03362.1 hypothetical protein EPI11_00085 [Flavobacterium cerinum]
MDTRNELKDQCRKLGIQFLPNETAAKLQDKIKKHIMKTATKNGDITQEQIEAWKKEYGKVHTIKVTVDKGTKEDGSDADIALGYLRKPKRDHKAVALSLYSQHKILESGEFLRDNCWLGGDERLKTVEDIADTAAIQASNIVKFLEAELGEA